MAECQSRRVERLPGSGPLERLRRAAGGARDPAAAPAPVDRIAHDRMPDQLEVHADLVGASRVQLQPEQVRDPEAADHEGVGACRAAGRGHGHALPILGMPGERRVDDRRALVEVAPCQRGVDAGDAARGDRGAEPPVGQVGLGDDHQPRRIAVQPVHDPGPALGPAGQRRAASHQRVHQRVVPVARRRMHHQTGRLVDDREMLVFVDDRQRNGGRLERAGGLVLGDPDGDALAAEKQAGGSRGLAVDVHRLVGHQPRRLGP